MASASFPKWDFNFSIIEGIDKFVSSKQVDDYDDKELLFDGKFKPAGEDFAFLKYHHKGDVQLTSVFNEGLLDEFLLSALNPQSVQTSSMSTCIWENHGVDQNAEPRKDRHCLSMSTSVEHELFIGKRLSLDGVTRLAGMKFIAGSPSGMDVQSVMGPYGVAFSCLADEDKRDVQFFELLLLCAEKISCKQYNRAMSLLSQCSNQYFSQGTPIQRLVYYFAKALLERIDRETGHMVSDDFWKIKELTRDLLVLNPDKSRIACHVKIPFSPIVQFTGMQAVLEKVVDAKSVHAIDFCIGSGVQWTVLMQALKNSDLQCLRITAIGARKEFRNILEETGKRLTNFARAIKLPFFFKQVLVDKPSELKVDHFEVDPNEKLVVYLQFHLRTLIGRPDQLDALMKVIMKLNPLLMVVTEADTNHNSPNFVERFIEALFFYSAYFDCLETYMERLDENRLALESFHFGEAIRNIVAAEGNERTERNVKIDIWRAYFARFRIVEEELSPSSMYQASLVVKRFSAEKFCKLHMNGKALIVGWKNTSILSLSVWKFA